MSAGDVMEPQSAPHNTVWSFPFTSQDWEQTPPADQAYVHTLHDEVTQIRARVEALETRLVQNSTTSHRPPSSDAPYKKSGLRTTAVPPRKAGGKPGHPGHRQALLPPTTVYEVKPVRCACRLTTFSLTKSFYTHQVIELPSIAMEVTHFVLHQSWCAHCGNWTQAQVPAAHASGYGPRFS